LINKSYPAISKIEVAKIKGSKFCCVGHIEVEISKESHHNQKYFQYIPKNIEKKLHNRHIC